MTKQPIALILAAVSTPEQATDDKQSLDTQENELRAIAHTRAWHVERVLRIPGFSRDYLSWEECAAEMQAEGISAMTDLKRMTENHDYDIFMVRDADRFGRTQALVMQIAETICIRHNLRIYSQMDNQLIEGLQSRFWAAMAGLRVAGDQDKRKKYRQDGMDRRAQRGLPTAPRTPFTHIVLRDANGKAIKSIVDENKRHLFDDIFRVFVTRRVAYQKIEKVLFEEYGHASPFGDAYHPNTIYSTLTNPFTHGHSALHYKNAANYSDVGEWRFKSGYPVPAGVTIYYNTHQPVWTGEPFERIFAEFQRRQSIRGSASPARARMFAGLLLCGECGYNLVYAKDGLRCMSHYNVSATRPDCTQFNWVPETRLQAWFHERLLQLMQTHDWSALFMSPQTNTRSTAEQLDEMDRDIRRIEAQIMRVIDDRAQQDIAAVIEMYQKRLTALGEQLERLRQQRDALEYEVLNDAQTVQQRDYTLNELVQIGLLNFWQLPHPQINQLLHRLLGKRRLVALDGAIIATQDAPHRTNRKRENHDF